MVGGVQFRGGVEEEKAWISEHLYRAQTARPLLDLPHRRVSVESLCNVVASHRPRLQRVVDLGRTLLRRCPDLQQSNVEADLTHLDSTWRQLERAVRQQKEQLEPLNVTGAVCKLYV